MNRLIVIGISLLFSCPAYCFRPFILHTGKNQVKLVEFYTSETCGKCEAPEKWLGTLRPDKGLFKKFIVASFHIIENHPPETVAVSGNTPEPGNSPEPIATIEPIWNDIFAKPEFSSRKKDVPTFVVNGENLQWDENFKLLVDKPDDVGDLSVARNKLKEFEITFSPKEKFDNVNVNVALLGNGISRQIASGENANKTLDENFVVLEFVTKNLHKSGSVFSGHVKMDLAKNPAVKTFSAVFWTTKEEDTKPIQATGGDLKLE